MRQHRSQVKPQNKPQQIKEEWNQIKQLYWHQKYGVRNQLQENASPQPNPWNKWRLKDLLLSNQWVKEEIKEEILKIP